MKSFYTLCLFAFANAAFGLQDCYHSCGNFVDKSVGQVLSIKHIRVLDLPKQITELSVNGKACICVKDRALSFVKFENSGKEYIIEKRHGTWQKFQINLERYTRYAYSIKQSFLKDGIKAGINPKVLQQAELMFKDRIRFNKDIHLNDKIKLLVEHRDSTDVLLMASIQHKNSVLAAMRFNSHGKSRFYDSHGHAMVDGFDRAPIKYKRVSSPFRKSRKHPILGYSRPHKGVDLAAPSGTPIHATSSGEIVSLGALRGYGRTVIIKHHGNYQTLYAHLHAFARGLRVGDHVSRKQLIGYVGMTGLATAPHCHYEFRIGNVAYDPMKVHLPNGEQLTGSRFKRYNKVWAARYKKLLG